MSFRRRLIETLRAIQPVLDVPGVMVVGLRVLAAGQADLVRETLDFRIEPKFAATLKGQGDATDRTGVTVPVLVSGTFAKPSFQPDLKGLVQQHFGEDLKDIQQKLEKGELKKDDLKSLEKKAKGILKGLPFGN